MAQWTVLLLLCCESRGLTFLLLHSIQWQSDNSIAGEDPKEGGRSIVSRSSDRNDWVQQETIEELFIYHLQGRTLFIIFIYLTFIRDRSSEGEEVDSLV